VSKDFVVEKHIWKNIPGQTVLKVIDAAPGDWPNQKDPAGNPLRNPVTIADLKKRFSGIQGHLVNPYTNNQVLVDLSNWSHLDDSTYLGFVWVFQPDVPVSKNDPHYPTS